MRWHATPSPATAAASRLIVAERFVAPQSGLAAVRLPLDVVARHPAPRLRVAVLAEDPIWGERLAILRPRDLRPDETLRLEFTPFAAPAGTTFILGVSELPLAAEPPVAGDLAAWRASVRGRPPIRLDCQGEDGLTRDAALLPDEAGIRAFRERPPATGALRVAHWIDQFWCDAYGLYLSGWVHAFEHPVRRLSLAAGGREVATESFRDRPDLLIHYPEHEHVRHGGFSLYLAVAAGHSVRLRIETDAGMVDLPLDLPAGPLPPLPPGTNPDSGNSPILHRFVELANARGGRTLQLGTRSLHGAGDEAPLLRRLLRGGIIGLDIHPGSWVDVVGDAHGLSHMLRERSVAAVISAAVLEHVVAPWVVAAEINRVLAPGGLTYHYVPSAWPPHAQPNDFWRFSAAALAVLFGPETGFEVLASTDAGPATLMPGPQWRSQFLEMPTLPTFAGAEILARKVADLAPAAVAWPLDREASQRRARCYPVAGLAALREGRDSPLGEEVE